MRGSISLDAKHWNDICRGLASRAQTVRRDEKHQSAIIVQYEPGSRSGSRMRLTQTLGPGLDEVMNEDIGGHDVGSRCVVRKVVYRV